MISGASLFKQSGMTTIHKENASLSQSAAAGAVGNKAFAYVTVMHRCGEMAAHTTVSPPTLGGLQGFRGMVRNEEHKKPTVGVTVRVLKMLIE